MKISRRVLLSIIVVVLAVCTLYAVGVYAFRPDELQKLKTTKQCPNCDLTGANLVGMDLGNANLLAADLNNANLSTADLASANLSYAILANANLTGADLNGADLTHANLCYTNLTAASLRYTNLTGAILNKDTNFGGANLSGAIWIHGHKCKEGSIGQCNF